MFIQVELTQEEAEALEAAAKIDSRTKRQQLKFLALQRAREIVEEQEKEQAQKRD